MTRTTTGGGTLWGTIGLQHRAGRASRPPAALDHTSRASAPSLPTDAPNPPAERSGDRLRQVPRQRVSRPSNSPIGTPNAFRTVRDVMIGNPDCAADDDTLDEVDRKMRRLMVAFLPVCGDHRELRGIITINNLRPSFLGPADLTVTAGEVAADPPLTVEMNDPVDGIQGLMAEYGVWLVPVVDGQRLVGIIRYPGLHQIRGSSV